MIGKRLAMIGLIMVVLMTVCAFSLDIKSGDSIAIFDNVTIPEGTTVTGDAVAVFGNMELQGSVKGDVVAVFGNVDIYGEAGGDVVAVFGNVNVKNSAIVGGAAVGVFGNVDREPGAVIRGEIVDTKPGNWTKSIDFMPDLSTDAGSIVGMMITFVLSCLAVVVVPDRVAYMTQSCQYNIARSFGLGILVLLGMMLLIPALMITIIGIIPAILLIFAFVIITFVSMASLYIALGRKVAAAVEGNNAVYIHLLIGLVIVSALQMIPFIGFLVGLAVFLVALGIAFDTRVGKPIARKTL